MWVSFPIVNGVRFGIRVPVGSNAVVTKQIPWQQCLSPTGKVVLRVGGTGILAGVLWWMVSTEGHWHETWLSMLIAFLVVSWFFKRALLDLFPLGMTEEPDPAAPEVNPQPPPRETPIPARPAQVWRGGKIVG
jgi:hypothetical protein